MLSGFEFILNPESIFADVSKSLVGDSLDYVRRKAALGQIILQQYALRIIFYEPTLFMKSLGNFTLEDMALFAQLFIKKLAIGLLWLKDSIFEALTMRHHDAFRTAANVGDTGKRINHSILFTNLLGSRKSGKSTRWLDI